MLQSLNSIWKCIRLGTSNCCVKLQTRCVKYPLPPEEPKERAVVAVRVGY